MRTIVGLVLSVVLLSPGAAAIAFAPMPPDPISRQAHMLDSTGIPTSNSPLAPLVDASIGFDAQTRNGHSTTLDDATTLNALAIDHNGGDLSIADVSNSQLFRSRNSSYDQSIFIDPSTILAALMLGIPHTSGPIDAILTVSRTYGSSDTLTRERALSDENTLSDLALHANGIALDPHLLLDVNDSARGGSTTAQLAATPIDPHASQTVSLSPLMAAVSAVAYHSEGRVSPLQLENVTLSNSDRGSDSRSVDLPTGLALDAIALKNNGGDVRGEDLLSVDETAAVSRVDSADRLLSPETVLNALILGAHA